MLLLNGCFLAAGVGVTGAAGWWRGGRALVGSLGISFLCGVATFGVVAQLLYVLGASLARWQVVLVCVVAACGAIRGIRRGPSEPRRARTRLDLLAIPVTLVLALVAVDLWYQPLWAYDSWTFWTPKAHALYALNGLDPGWFTSAALISKDYPILLPSVEAAGFRFTGYETGLLDLQSWLLFAAFVRAVYEVGVTRARPAVLWAVLLMLALAPSALDQLAAAEADIPVAVFFAAAGLCLWAWLVDERPAALVLATVLAAGAAATKVEGSMFVIALFVAVAAVAARASWRRAGMAILAGAAALAVGALPWRIWIAHHDVVNQASFGRVTGTSFLAHHAARVPIAVGYLGMKLVDPRAWLLLLPLAVFVAVDAFRRGRRPDVSFVVGVACLAFVGLVLAYWSTPFPLHYQLATSARRVITAIALFAAAMTPLLSAEAGLAADLQHDPAVVQPRLVARRSVGRQPRDVREPFERDAVQHRRAEQRGREAGLPATARHIGLELVWPPVGGAALPGDGAGHDAVALGVRGAHTLLPVGRRLDTGREVGVGLPDARLHLDVDREWRVAELREPGAAFGDEVEGEPVRAGRDRRPHPREHGVALARTERRRRGPDPVPDDRVAQQIEPVVREEDALAPRDAPRVLQLDGCLGNRACTWRLERRFAPVDRERSLRHGRLAYSSVAPLLTRAARREQVERTPVWFMRQAGRSLPEYRALRERHSFWEVAGTPELCAEVTLQPVRRHGVDAAVMFADIMTPVIGMGIDVDLVEGVGPVVASPVRSRADVDRLRVPEPEEAFAPVLDAVRIVRKELGAEQAVVAFCGGPFTVAGYLVEGRPSRDFATLKALMYTHPDVWRALLDKLADCFAAYVAAQVRAGADVVQLFDSWVGSLSPDDYDEFVAPWSARILAAAGAPTIHFGTGTATLLEAMARSRWRRDRPRLAHSPRRRLGTSRRPRRAGKPRPGRPARALGTDRGSGARCPPASTRPARAHLQPRPRGPAGHRSGRADAPGGARTRARP